MFIHTEFIYLEKKIACAYFVLIDWLIGRWIRDWWTFISVLVIKEYEDDLIFFRVLFLFSLMTLALMWMKKKEKLGTNVMNQKKKKSIQWLVISGFYRINQIVFCCCCCCCCYWLSWLDMTWSTYIHIYPVCVCVHVFLYLSVNISGALFDIYKQSNTHSTRTHTHTLEFYLTHMTEQKSRTSREREKKSISLLNRMKIYRAFIYICKYLSNLLYARFFFIFSNKFLDFFFAISLSFSLQLIWMWINKKISFSGVRVFVHARIVCSLVFDFLIFTFASLSLQFDCRFVIFFPDHECIWFDWYVGIVKEKFFIL